MNKLPPGQRGLGVVEMKRIYLYEQGDCYMFFILQEKYVV